MKKKIIITGGLGYIGTELCKLYSGLSWHHEILVIDNRFISERVNQLRNWNMNFLQGDILDKEMVNKHFKDADVVHHLAGITNVPRIKSESIKSHDEKIMSVAKVLKMIKDNPDLKSNLISEDDKTKLMSLSGVKKYPMRVKCATLPWHTLISAMTNKPGEVNTEKED